MKTFLRLMLVILALTAAMFCISCDDDDDDSSSDNDAGDDDGGGDDDASGDDDVSGDLTWQDPPSDDFMNWEDAIAYCDNLSFDGHDDWRLPTISELRNLILGCAATVTGGACNVTDDCLDSSCWNDQCGGCYDFAGPGYGGAYWPDEMTGEILWYWSSSPVADYDYGAWFVDFGDGFVSHYFGIDDRSLVRCVR